MFGQTRFAVFALLGGSAYAHIHYGHLIVNNTVTDIWKYIRKPYGDEISYSNTRNDFYAIVTGFHGIDLPLMVCGRDNGTGPVTSTATVVAGSEVGFKAWSGPEDNPYTGYDKIIHPGPGQVYLSKVPEGVSVGDYDGSGDWFKVAYAGPKDDKEWSLYGTPEMRFNLPEKTPPGKYLMRMEFFMPSLSVDPMGPQWYVSCAHVEVVGPGGGQLKDKDLIRFPEGYDMFDPGLVITYSQMSGEGGLSSYVPPGPAVWTG